MTPDGLPRAPDAVLAAVTIDRNRRELYVEGASDVALILFLAGTTRDPRVIVSAISEVLIESEDNGEKGRLLKFAQMTAGEERLLFFADADQDRVFGTTHTSNVILTDGPDAESYALQEEGVARVLLLGIQTTRITASHLLQMVLNAAKRVALLRYVQRRHWPQLKVNAVRPQTAITVRNGELRFDFDRFVRAVVNRTGRQPAIGEVLIRLSEADAALAAVDDRDLVRGHDVMEILAEVLKDLGACRADAPRLLRVTLPSDCLDRHPNLRHVVEFAQGR